MASASGPAAGPDAEARYAAEVRANLARNYLAHLAHGLLGQTGFRLINAPTFVPAYVFAISGSDFAVGLARACQSLGMFLSPVMGATSVEHRRRVLPVGFVVGGAMRVQVLGLALAGFFLPAPWDLYLVCLFLGLFGFFLGMQGVIFNFLVSKVIPVGRRGVLLGLRQMLSGLIAAAVGAVGGRLVESEALGNGYAATFLIAFVLTACGLAMLAFVREPEAPSVRPPSSFARRLRDLPRLLRGDRAFSAYLVARALGNMGRMALPFCVLFADERLGVSGAQLGQLTVAVVLGMSVPNPIWGWAADRFGFRSTLVSSLLLWIAAPLVLMQAESFGVLLAVFGALGAGQGGFMLSAQNLVLEFGMREDLPLRIAAANSASELVGTVAPLLGGGLAALWGYEVVFWSAVAAQSLALMVTVLGVSEPRHR
ncbi:MAG: MFS transporter [Myxococcota bacterium]|nr:MFS transporter [Myxococcota bacterium]